MASTSLPAGLPGAFVVTAGESAGQVIRFQEPGVPLTFGRAADCVVRFHDPSISRIHACAACIGDTYVLDDAGSRNGTFVNGRRINAATALQHGDLVLLGTDIGLRFCLCDAQEDTGLMRTAEPEDCDLYTGLRARPVMERALDEAIERSKRNSIPLSVMMIVVDRFQRIIDMHGLRAGDELMSGLARVIRLACRNTDLPGRFGTQEFVVIAPCTRLEDAYWVAERIRDDIARTSFPWHSHLLEVTVSAGVASLDCCGSQTDRLSLLFLAHQRAWIARNSRDVVVCRGGSVSALIPDLEGDSTLACSG